MLLRPKSDFPSVKLYRRRTAAIVLLRTREVSSMDPRRGCRWSTWHLRLVRRAELWACASLAANPL